MSKSFEVIFKEFANSETFVMSRGLLEDYKRQAAQEERNRIVSVLEEILCVCKHGPHCLNDEHLHPADVLDIIKGENK